MGLTELYYRAFKAFRHYTKTDSECNKLRKTIEHSNRQEDVLTSIRFDCEIEPDWVENIEEGLIYVEKAIREERQFIRTEGEVVPIERVKRVSKASVRHLARHSNLITRVPKDRQSDLIPDELYMVEKLNDYAVYENRFLYMLLSYLKDFIQMRLVKIRDKTTTYKAHMTMNKKLNENQRHLEYRLKHTDIQKNDPYLLERYKKIPLVNRVENIHAITVSLLETPLMREVSKAPMIKPPVVKTNVLRMNPNFRAALKLYDYIVSYNKDGYAFKEIRKTLNPFPAEMGDEVADEIQLLSNIAYTEGNDLRETLEKQLAIRLKEEKEAEARKLKDDLKRLKKRIVEMHDDPSEYILKLEKRNAQLEKLTVELASEKEKNAELSETIETLNTEKSDLEDKLEKLQTGLKDKNREIDALNQKYFDDMTEAEEVHQQEFHDMEQAYQTTIANLKEAHATTIADMKATHEKTIADLNAKHAHEVQELITRYETEYDNLIKTHEKEKQALIDEHETEMASLNAHIAQLDETIETLENEKKQLILEHEEASHAYQEKVDALKHQLRRLNDEKKTANARYLALKKEQGLLTDDFDHSSKVKFRQLESEMKAYKRLFKEQWKKAKRQIREDVKKDTFMSTDKPSQEDRPNNSNQA